MAGTAAVDDELPPEPSTRCWCCGRSEGLGRLVHLGNHPEVAVCARCARSLSKRAREIEDQAHTGFAVGARHGLRRLRKAVVRRGWHHNRFVGRAFRWVGRFTP